MKKLLLLLATILLPMVASADESGICGENLIWYYDEATQTLTISGTGPMTNFEYGPTKTNHPWYRISSYVQAIIINEGVTSIGDNAFSSFWAQSVSIPSTLTSIGKSAFSHSFVKSVTLPNSVVAIGEYAFSQSSLASINIPDNITAIAPSTFSSCSGLSNIIIPNSVTSIGSYAFSGCSGLTSISIPNDVTTIEYGAFSGCGMSTISIPNSITSIEYNTFQDCTNLTSVELGDNIATIGNNAFENCNKLTSINLPNGLVSIGEYAFQKCSALTSVTFPSSLMSIGDFAYWNCTSLTDVRTLIETPFPISDNVFSLYSIPLRVPNDAIERYQTTEGWNNFDDIIGLNDLMKGNGFTVDGIKYYVISGNSKEVCVGNNRIGNGTAAVSTSREGTIIIPSSVVGNDGNTYTVTMIGGYAFNNCSKVTDVKIPETVTCIGGSAFKGTAWLNNHSDGLLYLDKCLIGYKNNKPSGDVILAEGTRVIADDALRSCEDVISLEIPSTVVVIGLAAFSNCNSLKSVNIGNGVTVIDGNAFSQCYALTNVIIPNSVNFVGNSAFSSCTNLKSVILSENLRKIDNATFYNCSSLASIVIPSSVTTISDEATFAGCTSLKTMVIEDGDNALKFVNQYMSSSNSKSNFLPDSPLDSVYIGRNLNYEFFPSGSYYPVKNYSPFKSKKELRTVKLGSKVTTIPNEMFAGCTNLTSVDIKGNIDKIAYSAFSGCENLCSINLPDGIKAIEESAFYHCKSLQSICIPGSVETIEKETFSGCESLTSLSISDGVTSINESAFAGCKSLPSIVIPISVVNLSRYAFASCTNLKDVRIEEGSSLLSSQGYAFNGCNNVESIHIGRNIFSTGDFLNYNRNIYDLTIGKTVNQLIGKILNNCTIKTITFEDSTDTLLLYNHVMTNNFSQKTLPFDKSIIDSIYLGRVIVGKDYFYPYSTMTPFSYAKIEESFSLRIGNNIEEIGDNAYSSWKIDTLYIPKNVKKIGSSPFNDCAYLHDIFIEDGDETLEFGEGIGFYGIQLNNLYLGRNVSYPENKSPFSRNKEALTNLTIGNHVTDIGDGQFTGCKSLTELNFPESLKRIGKQAFYGCEGLTALSIPSNIEEVGKDAFNLCTGLTSVVIEDGEEALTIDNNFMNGELKKVYLGRNIIYPDPLSPFSGLDYLDSLTIGSKVTAIGKSAFAACPKLKDVISYAEMVPETDEYAFTQSYLPNATLHIPCKLYGQYSRTIPWSLFGNIKTLEGLYNLTYLVDGEVYKTSEVEEGAIITPEEEPCKEGYTFSGWSDIPETMPAHDVIIKGTFLQPGDANGDGKVSVTDAVYIVNYVLQQPAPDFREEAADLNGDGKITVTDAVQIINIILNQ